MNPSSLAVPQLDEGSCLLQSSALEEIRTTTVPGNVTVFHYAPQPHRAFTSPDDPSNSRVETSGTKTPVVGNLYLEPNQSPRIIDPRWIPQRTSDNSGYLTIIDQVGCDVQKAKVFISAVEGVPFAELPSTPPTGASQNSQPSPLLPPSLWNTYSSFPPDPQSVMDSRSLCHRKNDSGNPKTPASFITGVSFVASATPKEFLTLFVSIPYLGLGSTVSGCGSRTLRQYRHQLFDKTVSDRSILVHQTWFLLFNNEKIGIFRSQDDKYNTLAPLFPYQQRDGAFHALVHMISNTLTLSETEVLERFRMLVTEWELKYPGSEGPNKKESTTGTPNNEETTPGTAMVELGSYITDLCTMMQVVHSQTKYLENLRQIFQTSYHSDFGRWPHSNEFEIPFMENNKEQMRKVMTSFTTILEQREKFCRELKYLVEELEILQNVFLRSAQADCQQSTANSLKRQGETISLFTFLTSIFLPLGFLASYFAIDPDGYQSPIKSASDFWRISGPVTGVMCVLFLVFLYRPDSEMKADLWGRMIIFWQRGKAAWTRGKGAGNLVK